MSEQDSRTPAHRERQEDLARTLRRILQSGHYLDLNLNAARADYVTTPETGMKFHATPPIEVAMMVRMHDGRRVMVLAYELDEEES